MTLKNIPKQKRVNKQNKNSLLCHSLYLYVKVYQALLDFFLNSRLTDLLGSTRRTYITHYLNEILENILRLCFLFVFLCCYHHHIMINHDPSKPRSKETAHEQKKKRRVHSLQTKKNPYLFDDLLHIGLLGDVHLETIISTFICITKHAVHSHLELLVFGLHVGQCDF